KIWPVRTQVFISYSRRDRRWANELKTMLSPAVRKAKVTIYLDTDQNPGIDWEKELKKA
ncbi:TIR domain-containing protein, partial [candidate division KSB1 bacterium]|nr:TIR domain-containing protein [candidate division KSB1 bacterium]NIS27846.1 TIR domain-containing protein [candidate division KSB1 bacterium]NIT74730.1 TIR domain-containing protein [candidate division KSB1 bacterium]NIU28511.1 TIR domain-containing protein [candidate division KSB1 bacterium]NIU91894.1 TIR domain-containing protein [candidate division KSB1 bacterium]